MRPPGHSKAAFRAAQEYITLRKEGKPVLLKEIAHKHNEPPKKVRYAYRALIKTENVFIPIEKPEVWINRFCEQLNLPEAVRAEATTICQLTRRAISGTSVSVSAAAAIYIACRKRSLPFYQRGLAETAGCNEVSIRNRYRRMLKVIDQLQSMEKREASPSP